MELSPSVVAWLTSPLGQEVVDHALSDPDIYALRAAFPQVTGDLVGWALTQAQIRHKHPAKWLPISTWAGVEQGTPLDVARHRADQLRRLGVGSVADLTAGLGFDTTAFLEAGLTVTAVERDPGIAAALAVNCPTATVINADAQTIPLPPADAYFVDPARRGPDRGERRAERDPAKWSPPLSWVFALPVERVLAKVAPGIAHSLIPPGWHAEWVSSNGSLIEASLWSSALNPEHHSRSATVLGVGTLHATDDASVDVGDIGDYLIEPDDAVIRAGLIADLAHRIPSARLIDEKVAWLTADSVEPRTGFARYYRVIDILPNHVRALRAELTRRGIGTLTVKTRAVTTTPEALIKQLKLPKGGNEGIVVLTRARNAGVTLLVERLG